MVHSRPGQGLRSKRKRGAGRIFGRSGVFGTNLGCEGPIPQDSCSGARECVGYEVETETRPYILQEWWNFQNRTPVKEARYSLQLPSGWEYKATWINHPEVQPTPAGANQWQWVVDGRSGDREEDDMPPWAGIAGQMIVSFFPPGGSGKRGFENWNEMGRWENTLFQGSVIHRPRSSRKSRN